LLRFFEQLDFRSVGEMLDTSEEAARKRVTRALEKLHSFLKHRGVTLSVAALGTALATDAVSAAPVGLAASIAGAVLAGALGTGGVPLSVFQAMSITKLKLGVVSALTVAAVATLLIVQHQSQTRLSEENRSLRQQLDQGGVLVEENQRLSNLVAQASSAQISAGQQMSELLRLRSEVGRLRQAAESRAATNANRVAAIVNGKPILESEVRQGVIWISMEPDLRRGYATQPGVLRQKLEELWTSNLEELINRELVVMDFDRRGLAVSPQDLSAQLARDNSSAHDREWHRRQIVYRTLLKEKLGQIFEPTQEEIEQYYDTHQKEFWAEEGVRVSRIILSKGQATDHVGVETARNEAAAISARLANRADFASEAIAHADGHISQPIWFERGELRSELEKVAFSLKPGETSDVIETADSFFIVRVLERRSAEQKLLGDVTGQIRKNLLKERREAVEKGWFNGLRSQVVIQRFPLPPDL
jgi:parvulin-like peptidyl-prolyl isomerase